MTENDLHAAQRERLAQLRVRRGADVTAASETPAATTARPAAERRVPPATGAKIATAGLATATVFGMVGAMSIAHHAAATNTVPTVNGADTTVGTTPPTTAPVKVIVVVHHIAAGSQAQPAGTSPAVTAATAPPVLRATPTPVIVAAPARPAAPAATPVSRSSGSHP